MKLRTAFSLDILAKDSGTGNVVAIENQLEITDHIHLGQIITYASGVDAKIIVWISKEVREEHRKAIDWLNQITGEEMEFFAIEIQLIKIDSSSPAPFFKVKASPNDWSKEQKAKINASAGNSERQEYYHEFFTKLLLRVHKEIPNFTNSKRVAYDSWKTFPSSISGCSYVISFRSGNRLSCEFYIYSGNKEKNKEIFDKLFAQKDLIEKTISGISWERLNDRKASRIAIYTSCTTDQEMLDWSIENLMVFRDCFKKCNL